MKIQLFVSALAGILVGQAQGQVATNAFAPINFGDTIFTATPSNATGSSGISSIYGSNGSTATFGTGGALVNPSAFTYTMTGPNTATLVTPAFGSTPQSTTALTFSSPLAGTYSTTVNGNTTTGSFHLAALPSSAPIANVSVMTNLSAGETATVGFIVAGTMPRRVLIRAIGPGLSTFGVTGALSNPSFTLFRGATAIARNDDWGTAATISTSGSGSTGTGTGTTGTGSTGTTTTGTGATGTGTTGTTGAGTTGTGSTGSTGTGTTGTGTATNGTVVLPASDTALATSQTFTQVGAFGLTTGSLDSASIVTLQPGAYTIQVSASTSTTSTGTTGSTGTGTGTGTAGTGTTTTGTGTTGTGTGTTGTGTTGTGAGTTGTGTGTTGTTTTGTTGTGTTGAIGTSTTGTGTTGSTGTTGTSTTVTTNSGQVLLEVYFVE